MDAFDIDHNNLIDPHDTLPREKKEGMLEKYIWLTSYDLYIYKSISLQLQYREENREYRFNQVILDLIILIMIIGLLHS